jgi:hypothetical protein
MREKEERYEANRIARVCIDDQMLTADFSKPIFTSEVRAIVSLSHGAKQIFVLSPSMVQLKRESTNDCE